MNSDIVPYVAAQTTAWLTDIRTADGGFDIGDGDVDREVETVLSNVEATVLRGFAGFALIMIVVLLAKGLLGDGKMKWGGVVVAAVALYVAVFPNETMDFLSSVGTSFQG